jgi:Uracil-DNA glycosylase
MDTLDLIAEEVRKCQKCRLWKYRKNAVPGEGNNKAEIMFIGEAPGENEDIEGKPFVGAAGKLLTRLINEVLGLSRDDVFITNLVKCRPPK